MAQRGNLEQQAPDGYQYDPVKMEYVRTGSSVGQQAGEAVSALRTASGMTGPQSTSSTTRTGGSAGGALGGAQLPTVQMGGGAGVQMPGGPGGTPGGASPQVPHIGAPDNTAANAAQFARAKDQTGEITRGAMTGLRSSMGARNMLGSGIEGRGTAAAINKGAGQLGDVVREQAIQGSDQANANAVTGYQGDISQRGQDLSSQQAANSLAANREATQYQGQISQRGQDISREGNQALLNMQQQQMEQQNLDRMVAALKLQLY